MSTQPLVLVADDEPRITKLVSIALSEEGFRVVTANGGEEALQQGRGVPAGHRPAGHRDARSRRHRGDAAAARAPARAGDPADRQGLDRRQGEGPRPRRRRLHRQAVPSGRARGPRPSGHPPLVRRAARRRRHPLRRRRDRPRAAHGHAGRRAGPALAHRVAAPPASRRKRRQGRPPHRAPDQGLGPRVPRRPPVPARLGSRASAASSARSRASRAGSGRSRASATCSTSKARRRSPRRAPRLRATRTRAISPTATRPRHPRTRSKRHGPAAWPDPRSLRHTHHDPVGVRRPGRSLSGATARPRLPPGGRPASSFGTTGQEVAGTVGRRPEPEAAGTRSARGGYQVATARDRGRWAGAIPSPTRPNTRGWAVPAPIHGPRPAP